MVEQQPSKLMTRVRFPSPAPVFSKAYPATRHFLRDGGLRFFSKSFQRVCPSSSRTNAESGCWDKSDDLRLPVRGNEGICLGALPTVFLVTRFQAVKRCRTPIQW